MLRDASDGLVWRLSPHLLGRPRRVAGALGAAGLWLPPNKRFMSQSQPSSQPPRFNPAEAGYCGVRSGAMRSRGGGQQASRWEALPPSACARAMEAFFPFQMSATASSLAKICQALCPNANTQLYSMPLGGTIEEATSTTGSRYGDLTNAGKFEQALDMNCSCRRQGQGWAEALADAEKRTQHHAGDILVTPEISEKMSRPAPEPKAIAVADAADTGAVALAEKTGAPALVLDADGVDLDLNAATAALSRATSGIGVEETGTQYYGLNQGQVIEQKGQDGSVKRVRIVGP